MIFGRSTMAHGRTKGLRVLTVALAVLPLAALASPSRASAAVRYADPASATASGFCDAANPCTAKYAIEGALAFDEIILRSGDYGSAASPMTQKIQAGAKDLSIHGEAGKSRPRLFFSVATGFTFYLQHGGRVSDLEIYNSSTAVGLVASRGAGSEAVVERVITSTKGDTLACSGQDALIRDSLCLAEGVGAIAAGLEASGTNTLTLRNVTAIADGPNSVGIISNVGTGSLSVSVVNSIARGFAEDLRTFSSGGIATISVGNSNFVTKSADTATTSVVESPAGSNQSGEPLFADIAAGDYSQPAGSPTIDAGTDDPLNGAFDLNGNARMLGASTDIGAFEYVPPTISPTPPTPAAPKITALKMSPRRWRIGRRLTRASRRPPTGTTISFKLAAEGDVRLDFRKAISGRRVRGKCVRRRRTNRRRRRCTRYASARTLQLGTIAAGSHRLRFQGRLSRKRTLRPGRYRLTLTASNTAATVQAKPISFRALKRRR